MKKQFTFGILAVLMASNILAQDITTVSASNETIGDHLNLEAVASLFGDSKDLEDFENKLNNPESQISNLDLNQDEQVDYLRVIETTSEDTHLIALQAVVGEDLFQDVATIEVEKDSQGNTQVQVVGDVYMYGPDYIIEPIYVRRPVIFSFFWRPYYKPYTSAFYWGYYPTYYSFWKPFKVNTYTKNVHVHIHAKHTYKRVTVRRSTKAVYLHKNVRRTDYAVRHPHRSYSATRTVHRTNGSKTRVTTVKRTNGVQKTPVNKKRPTTVKRTKTTKVVTKTGRKPTSSKQKEVKKTTKVRKKTNKTKVAKRKKK